MHRESKYIFHSDDLPIKGYAFFEEKRKKFCDITFNVGETSISAHRMILSAAIPYFFKIFCEKEEMDAYENVINFPDVDPVALESLINFAYTCQIEINNENVNALMSAACLLEMTQVRNECFHFMVNRLEPENALSTRAFLCQLYCSEELEKVDSYIRDNFEDVSLTNNFLNIPFEVLKDIIASDGLNVKSEENIFETVMKWVKRCPDERKHHLPHLICNIRMLSVKPSYIRNNILQDELIRLSPECRDLMDEAMYYHFVPEERGEVCSFVTRPRNVAENAHEIADEIPCIYILYSKSEITVQTLYSKSENWETSLDHKFDLQHKHTTAELNKKMYLFFPNLTYVYDLERNTLFYHKGMTLPRHWARGVSQSSKLYVIGGCMYEAGKDSQSNAAECFDPNTKEWTTLTAMNVCRGAPGAVADKEFIYVLGGKVSDSCVVKSVERYDTKTGRWTMMPPMLIDRCAPGCAILKERIYVCGGRTDISEITPAAEVFDPFVNEWNFISSMTVGRTCCMLIPFCGKLYCLGGRTDKGITNTVEVYELAANEWKYGPPTKEKLTIVSAAVVCMASI